MKKLFKDRRGNVWINVLVILVLATCLSSGFIFLTSSSITPAVIFGVNVLNEVHLEENEFNFYVKQAGEKAVEETYKQLGGDEPTEKSFLVNFQKEFKIYNLDENYLKLENFEIDSSKNILKFKIDNWKIQKDFKTEGNYLEVLYSKELSFEFELKK